MRAFFAILKLTLKDAVRSHIFQLLLLVLAACVFLVPMSIAGDGTAYGYIQIALKYSMSSIVTILSLSSIWLGCYVMCRDVESYQLHMVASKPVSRPAIWLGKFFGVVFIHTVLLIIAATALYFMIMYQYNQQNFSAVEKKQIESEVLVGRRVFMPQAPDFDKLARLALKERFRKLRAEGKEVSADPQLQAKALQEMKREQIARYSELKAGAIRPWVYINLPEKPEYIYLRYRAFIGKISSEKQRVTRGQWLYGVASFQDEMTPKNKNAVEKDKDRKKKFKIYPWPVTRYPEQIKCGAFKEITLQGTVVTPDRKVIIWFVNYDPHRKSLFFQSKDGPKLLVKVTSFTENYLRSLLVSLMQLMILCGIACAASSVLYMPTAVFLSISYTLFGSFAGYLTGESKFAIDVNAATYFISKFLLAVVIPMQRFAVTGLLSDGELIEWSLIGTLFLEYFVIRALPIFLLGIFLYRRRELGLVIRK